MSFHAARTPRPARVRHARRVLLGLPTAAPGLVDCTGERTGEDIAGDIRVVDGQTCILRDLTVNGDIDVLGGGRLEAFTVRVSEDIDAEGNTIGGDLECEANDPAPTGGGNQVSGERQGQCANL